MSKGLEVLEEIKEKYKDDNGLKRRLSIIEKELEALEIIKKKRLAWVWFIDNKLSFEDYNKSLDFLVCEPAHKPKKLTQEEYDLLREVLL